MQRYVLYAAIVVATLVFLNYRADLATAPHSAVCYEQIQNEYGDSLIQRQEVAALEFKECVLNRMSFWQRIFVRSNDVNFYI